MGDLIILIEAKANFRSEFEQFPRLHSGWPDPSRATCEAGQPGWPASDPLKRSIVALS